MSHQFAWERWFVSVFIGWASRIVVGYVLIGLVVAAVLIAIDPGDMPLHEAVVLSVMFWPAILGGWFGWIRSN